MKPMAEPLTLADEGVAQIALYLLDGTSPTEFLKGLETIEAIYTAEAIDQDGIPFTLKVAWYSRWQSRAMMR
jgi:hypothetical protein